MRMLSKFYVWLLSPIQYHGTHHTSIFAFGQSSAWLRKRSLPSCSFPPLLSCAIPRSFQTSVVASIMLVKIDPNHKCLMWLYELRYDISIMFRGMSR